jgi:UDP-glucose 4-epimerase
MDLIVTGGLGSSGTWIVDRLAGKHDVVCLDHERPRDGGCDDVDYRAVDLTDTGAVFDILTAQEPDAVVHWAAIPVEGTHAGTELYRNNTLAAHNVLTAAGRVGADIVQASSDGAYGFFFAAEPPVPDELPVTESHALRPEGSYGLSKVVTEEIGKMVTRRDPVSVASLRPSWIQFPEAYPCRESEYVENPDAGAGNYWSYVDVRDVVDMVEAALDANFDGHEAFNCVASDNALGGPLQTLMREHVGGVPDNVTVEGDSTAFATAKARRMLGWEPTRSWKDVVA